MNPDAPSAEESIDECFRCGYDLRGIANEQPCPECGLLAERSRRTTDELHDTRPRWLRRLAVGVWLIFPALLIAVLWLPFGLVPELLEDYLPVIPSSLSGLFFSALPLLGFFVAALILPLAVFLLTTPERVEASDRADRGRRRWLRICATVPLLTVLVQFSVNGWNQRVSATGRWED